MTTHHVCLSGNPACSGVNQCPACNELWISEVVEPAMRAANFHADHRVAVMFAQAYEAGKLRLFARFDRDPQLRARLIATPVAAPPQMYQAGWGAAPQAPQAQPAYGNPIAPPPAPGAAPGPPPAPQVGAPSYDPSAVHGAPDWFRQAVAVPAQQTPAASPAPPAAEPARETPPEIGRARSVIASSARVVAIASPPVVTTVVAPPAPPAATAEVQTVPVVPIPRAPDPPSSLGPVRAAAAPRPSEPRVMVLDELAQAGAVVPLASPVPNGAAKPHD